MHCHVRSLLHSLAIKGSYLELKSHCPARQIHVAKFAVYEQWIAMTFLVNPALIFNFLLLETLKQY